MFRLFKILSLRLLLGISGLLLILAIPYFFCPVYHFPEPRPFSGEAWFNPYQDGTGTWLKANFQVQSYTWLGLTAGQDKTADVVDVYRKLGYDIVTISDYQYINKFNGLNINYLPVYEHGYNAGKKHQVVIGAQQVEWLEYFYWQNRHHKQHIIHTLKRSAPFVALAHAGLMDAYRPSDMTRLTDYDALEVLNHFGDCLDLWDTALSAGKSSWIIGNDDSHKIHDPGQTGVCWTMIQAESNDNRAIIQALKSGRMYGVRGKNARNEIQLEYVSLEKHCLTVACAGDVREFRFIGQGGQVLKTVTNSPRAEIELQPEDRYVRTEISGEATTIFLNPVFRYSGAVERSQSATIDFTRTWIQRLIFLLSFLGLASALIRERLRQLRTSRTVLVFEEN